MIISFPITISRGNPSNISRNSGWETLLHTIAQRRTALSKITRPFLLKKKKKKKKTKTEKRACAGDVVDRLSYFLDWSTGMERERKPEEFRVSWRLVRFGYVSRTCVGLMLKRHTVALWTHAWIEGFRAASFYFRCVGFLKLQKMWNQIECPVKHMFSTLLDPPPLPKPFQFVMC